MQQCLVSILMSLISFELCSAGGTVSLQLRHFKNFDGKLATGKCCESPFTFLCHVSKCDHYFHMCLDEPNGSATDMNQCSMGKYKGGTSDKNEISFEDFIGSEPNPKELKFSAWPGGARLKVLVLDNDGAGGTMDEVDFLSTKVQMEANRTRSVENVYSVENRTKLYFSVDVYCDENYYGTKCEVYCKPSANCPCTSDGSKHCGCAFMEPTKLVQTFNLRKTPGKAASGFLFESQMNLHRCAHVCIEHPECGSFNYNKKESLCQLVSGCESDFVSSAEFDFWQ